MIMSSNADIDFVVIGHDSHTYAIIYDSLIEALHTKIKRDQLKLKNSRKENDQRFCNISSQEIISEYLDFPEKLYMQNPLRANKASLTEELASAYLLNRFIGSSVNANKRLNTFKSCFSNNWDVWRKVLLKENLEPNEEAIKERHIGRVLFKLDYREILKQTEFRSGQPRKSKAVVRRLLDQLCEQSRETNKDNPREQLFTYGPTKVFTTLLYSVLEGCELIERKGGAVAYLQEIDRVVHDKTKEDSEKVKELADEIQKISGFADALSRDFFKDMGYGIFSKPDVHVMDLIRRLNLHLFYKWGNNDEERASQLLSEIAQSVPDTNTTANQVDKIMWLLKSGNYHLHNLSKKFRLSDKECESICDDILEDLRSNRGWRE